MNFLHHYYWKAHLSIHSKKFREQSSSCNFALTCVQQGQWWHTSEDGNFTVERKFNPCCCCVCSWSSSSCWCWNSSIVVVSNADTPDCVTEDEPDTAKCNVLSSSSSVRFLCSLAYHGMTETYVSNPSIVDVVLPFILFLWICINVKANASDLPLSNTCA